MEEGKAVIAGFRKVLDREESRDNAIADTNFVGTCKKSYPTERATKT